MCVVTLSVLEKCQHELPTIDYCPRAGRDIPEDRDNAAIKSGEEPLPRMACTPSLGWLIYETLRAPVTCKLCKAWLTKVVKHTYGGLMEEILKGDQKDGMPTEQNVQGSRGSVVYTSKGPALPGSPATRRKPN